MLGPPGAGKGTQGARLARQWGVPHIASGDILRRLIAEGGDTEYARAARVINEGKMVSDDTASGLVFGELVKPEAAGGFVLDGYPRNIDQAYRLTRFLDELGEKLDGVIGLVISEEAVIARLAARLTCVNCGESYHTVAAPPRVAGVCDRCGHTLEVRSDDRPDRVHMRLTLYHERTAPLLAYYREQGLLREADAEGEENAVWERVLAAAQGERVLAKTANV